MTGYRSCSAKQWRKWSCAKQSDWGWFLRRFLCPSGQPSPGTGSLFPITFMWKLLLTSWPPSPRKGDIELLHVHVPVLEIQKYQWVRAKAGWTHWHWEVHIYSLFIKENYIKEEKMGRSCRSSWGDWNKRLIMKMNGVIVCAETSFWTDNIFLISRIP